MVRYLFALFIIAIATSSFADESCDRKDESMFGMVDRAQADFNTADAEMNKLYKKILSVLVRLDESYKEEIKMRGWPGYVDSLKNSQRAWVKFRDGECDLNTIDVMGGSQRQVDYASCKEQMTKDRTKKLNNLLKEFK